MEVSSQPHAPADLTQGKYSGYSLDKGLGRPQSPSGRDGEEKKIPALAGNRTPVIQPLT